MSSFILAILKLLSSFGRGLRDPEFRALFILLLAMLISGTVFYTTVEHWSVVDSLYFSVSTLSTVGYGDLHPTTTLSKVFTIFYLVLGVGVFVGLITKVAQLRSDRLVNRTAIQVADSIGNEAANQNQGQNPHVEQRVGQLRGRAWPTYPG